MQQTPEAAAVSALEGLLQRWRDLDLPPLLQALIIIAVSFVIARLTGFVLTRIVARLTRKTKTHLDDRILSILPRPVFVTVFFLGLTLAAQTVALPPLFELVVVRVLRTLIVFAWLGFGFRFCGLMLGAISRNHQRIRIVEERTIPLFDNLAKIFLVGGASYAILLIWSIDVTAWLTSAGILGIAVGFAAKDTLANLFSGVFIIADAPYKLGDFVVLSSGERGKVTNVGIRSTRILTRDDIEITIPNNVIANSKIINESGGHWEKSRIRIKVGVAYGSDVDRVCELLGQIALRLDEVCASPEPRVRFRGFGDSSLDFELLCWIEQPVSRGLVSHLLYMKVYKTFQRENIEIPFPQRDLWIRQAAPPGSATAGQAGFGETSTGD